ncbi:MAG: UDP-N-acetylmuramoyl-L-alanyl-D-glutamate--2,6-diaminopimelate ligase [Cytophagales bacterium]|nr:UDP-N-acetylmuramoyl-L-alanyl-D-glutamate--2,6-diaminopimelate ligase [Cytophagales bacterium]
MKQLSEIINEVKIKETVGDINTSVEGITDNSGLVKPNFLFFAIKGITHDGHEFIDNAIEKGCKVIICSYLPDKIHEDVCYIVVKNIRESVYNISSKFYNDPAKKIKIIAVTGTNGKTSIVFFIYKFLNSLGIKVGMLSTIENRIADKRIKSHLTTPSPVQLHMLLDNMIKNSCEYCIMEASSHSIDQKRIMGRDIFIGIFSNLSHDHLDYHKTFINYINTKKILFDDLPKSSYSIINSDDKRSEYLIQNTKSKVFSYGLKTLPDYKGKIIESGTSGIMIHIDNINVSFKIIGDFNAYNLLSVYAVAKILKIDSEIIFKRLSQLNTPEGRMDFIQGKNNVIGIVDYAHTPDALKNVLKNISSFKKDAKVISIVGAGGDRDKSKRPEMGKIATQLSDYVFFTSDNPRDENEDNILSDIVKGAVRKNYQVISDRKKAIESAYLNYKKDSIILVAGKGHEKYQIIGEKSIPHDDKEILKKLIL